MRSESRERTHITNRQVQDNSSKLIFGNAELCAQFLRDYIDIPLLKDIRAEDIEDVSERYVPLFTSEREADTVKRVRLSDSQSLFFVSLIEHKTEVDYNVVMQLLRYMSYIWEDYEKEAAKQNQSCSRKDFRYPPILPIVYYEGKGEWTAVTNFKDRIFLNDVFAKYVPDFCYELVRLHDYTDEQLMQKKDEISLIMLLNKLQEAADFKRLPDIREMSGNIWEKTSKELLDLIAKVTTVLLYRLNLPQDEVEEVISRIKERKMPELFEHFKGYDVQETRKEARQEGREEGRKEGRKEGERRLLMAQICKKLRRDQDVFQIADALEEECSVIEAICQIARKYGPDYDEEKIYAEYYGADENE